MIEETLKNEIIEKIKELPTENKPHFAALYHQLIELYKAEETLAVGNRHINKSREPIIDGYTKAVSALATGTTKATSDNLGALTAEEGFFTAEEISQIASTEATKVNKYWFTVLNKIEPIQSFIVPEDEPALEALTQVNLTLHAENDNYEVEFHFAENDFFTNKSLKLEFTVNTDDECTKITSSTIDWKADKCLTEKVEKKTQTNKKTKKQRTIEKKVQKESFFHLFKNRSIEDAEEEEEEDEDEEGGLAGFYDVESIGEAFYYYKYFGSKYQAPAFYGVEIEELRYGDDMDGLGGEDDDEESREDDDDEEKPKKSKKAAIAGAGAGAKGPNQEECKKQ